RRVFQAPDLEPAVIEQGEGVRRACAQRRGARWSRVLEEVRREVERGTVRQVGIQADLRGVDRHPLGYIVDEEVDLRCPGDLQSRAASGGQDVVDGGEVVLLRRSGGGVRRERDFVRVVAER